MKTIALLSILFASYYLNAQSVVHSLLPRTIERPAFRDMSKKTQKDLAKEYAKIYLKTNYLRAPFITYYQLLFQSYLQKQPTIFKELGFNELPTYENTIDFLNSSGDFTDIIQKTQYGICMGVTSLMRKINMLAHFDPDNTQNSYVPYNKKLKIQYYKNLIDKLMTNQPVIIPEYASAREFTSDINLKNHFKRHALDQWALNNVTLQGGLLQMMRGVSNTMSRSYKIKVYQRLKTRLALGYNPKLFFALKGDIRDVDDMRIHVVQVFKVDEPDEDGNYKIHYWDPNFKFYKLDGESETEIPYWLEMQIKTADEKLDLTNDKKMAYKFNVARTIDVNQDQNTSTGNYKDISYLGIYKWDDAEIAEILSNYNNFCHLHPDLCQAK